MSSATIQLVTQGVQDAYLTGKPDVSYFSGIYRRHSPFLLYSEEYPFNTPIQYGGSGFVKIPYRGDLLLGASLKLTLPPLYTPGPGYVYPLQTVIQSNTNPYFNENNYVDAATQAAIRVNIPNFKTYFSDGSNTISYVTRSVKYYNTYSPFSDPISQTLTGTLSSARLILLNITGSGEMITGRTVKIPSIAALSAVTMTISNPYKVQIFDSAGVNFTYNTIDITFSTPYLWQPIFSPVDVQVYNGLTQVASAKAFSASCLPWVRNDFITLSYNDAQNAWNWKSIYSLVKPFSSINLNISNTLPISIGSNISGIPYFTGNVTVATNVYRSTVTPVNLSSSEYITLNGNQPITMTFNDLPMCYANATSIQYPSQFDFSNINMTFTDFRMLGNLSVTGFDDENHKPTTCSITSIAVAPGGNIITYLDKVTVYQNTAPQFIFNLTPFLISNVSNVMNATSTTQTSVEFTNVSVFPNLTIKGLQYASTIKTSANSFVSNVVTANFNSQQIIPVTSPVNVTYSTGGSGKVLYSYFQTPTTISKIGFPTTSSSVFWGFDPTALAFTGARA
jgi:hypothetical protein